jgi:hypothetical protein
MASLSSLHRVNDVKNNNRGQHNLPFPLSTASFQSLSTSSSRSLSSSSRFVTHLMRSLTSPSRSSHALDNSASLFLTALKISSSRLRMASATSSSRWATRARSSSSRARTCARWEESWEESDAISASFCARRAVSVPSRACSARSWAANVALCACTVERSLSVSEILKARSRRSCWRSWEAEGRMAGWG